MRRHLLALLCPLLLSACSAELAVDTPPQSVTIPVTSVARPVYVEVAVDLPSETQELDVEVKSANATLTVFNPAKALTLKSSARLSFTGNATPDKPIFYTEGNPPPYFATAEELMPERDFPPNTHTPAVIDSPSLVKAIGKQRIWIIVDNSVSAVGTGGIDTFPLELQLNDIILHVVVARPFQGLEGALGPSGL
ncbi:hypothetical protein [Vitiosangium sp. GDMCC 1.1324]|uniref:hypothetical protein n=1 Tax=Vitiosangium sp. (strain GDMCC 1.1324) TaxID=2138576 RepID=UPI000D362F81|nr:hypothetical protein [Vitiosangium sp. GDMCC 1.1324]PTL83041.1 hypothetical protein DAT35_13565 [Vitiosangium sp. GDMCC 1.1324]